MNLLATRPKPPLRRLPQRAGPARMHGLTLVELMVSIVVMLMITMATVALYAVNANSYRTVESTQDMDATARYIFSIMGTAVGNAGYALWTPALTQGTAGDPAPTLPPIVQNLFNQTTGASGCSSSASTQPCPVLGFDSAALTTPTSDTDFGSKDNSNAVNDSDLFAVRFYGSGTGAGDGTMITCAGQKAPAPTGTPTLAELGMSLFWISTPKKRSTGSTDEEPSLYCTDRAWSTAGGRWQRSTDLIARGVEAMRIVYAEDRARADGTLYSAADYASNNVDDVPDQWVTAKDVGNWQHVKAIRVGFVLRGAPGSAQVKESWVGYPLGKDFVNSGSDYKFTAPNDNRLRKAYVATFMLRNNANL